MILRLISDAILAGTHLGSLRFPFMREALPIYDGGPLRGFRLPKQFTGRFRIPRDRYGLAPRDVKRWSDLWVRLSILLAPRSDETHELDGEAIGLIGRD